MRRLATFLRLMCLLALTVPASSSFAADAEVPAKWSIKRDYNDKSCPGYLNQSPCQNLCIYELGKDSKGTSTEIKKGCVKANHITNAERLLELLRRVRDVEAAMNTKSFKGVTEADLKDGFYPFAEKVLPTTGKKTALPAAPVEEEEASAEDAEEAP